MLARLGSALLFVAAFASFASAQPHDVAAVVTPCVANVDTQSIETPFTGTWTIQGGAKGVLNVARKGDELLFTGKVGEVPTFRLSANVEEPRTWRIPLDSTSTGIANNLNGGHGTTNATRFLVVNDAGKGDLKAFLELKGKKTNVTLVRKKEALILYGTYENGMKVFAQQCQAYYKAKGYEVTFLPGAWQGAATALLTAQETGHSFQRVVVVSHGGWDGPMFNDR